MIKLLDKKGAAMFAGIVLSGTEILSTPASEIQGLSLARSVETAVVQKEGGVTVPAIPPFKSLRYDEDYRYLRDPGHHTDFWDPIKYISLSDREKLVFLGRR